MIVNFVCILFLTIINLVRGKESGLQTGSPWPGFRRNAFGTSQSAFNGPKGNKIKELWKTLCHPSGYSIKPTSPVITKENLVYFGFTPDPPNETTEVPCLCAFNGSDGTRVVYFGHQKNISKIYRARVKNGPVVSSNGLVIFTISYYEGQIYGEYGDKIYALNHTNKPIWEDELPELGHFGGSPMISSNGMMYIAMYSDSLSDCTQYYKKGQIYGYNISDWDVNKWTVYSSEVFKPYDNCQGSKFDLMTPVISNSQTIYVVPLDKIFYALKFEGGKFEIHNQEYMLGNRPQGSCTLQSDGGDGLILVPTESDLSALRFDHGKFSEVWKYDISLVNASFSPVYSDAGIVYIAPANSIFAINATNGILIWEAKLGRDVFGTEYMFPYQTPSIARDGTVYMGYNVTIFAFNGTNGKIVWRYPLLLGACVGIGDFIYTAIGIGEDGSLFFGTYCGVVYRLRDDEPNEICEPPLVPDMDYSSIDLDICHYDNTSVPTSFPSASPTSIPTSFPTCGIGSGGSPGNCETCPSGHYSKFSPTGYSCNPCGIGEYNIESGSTSCMSCEYPFTTISEGSTSCSGVCICLLPIHLVIFTLVMMTIFIFCVSRANELATGCLLLMLLPCTDYLSDVMYILYVPAYNSFLFNALVLTFIASNSYFIFILYNIGARPKLALFSVVFNYSKFIWLQYDEGIIQVGEKKLTFKVLDNFLKFIWLLLVGIILGAVQIISCALITFVLLGCLLVDLILLSCLLFLGLFIFQSKVICIREVYNVWFRLWTGDVKIRSTPQVDTRLLNESIFIEMIVESLPQLIIQIINNSLMGSLSRLAILSASFAFLLVVNGIWSYSYVLYVGSPVSEVNLDKILHFHLFSFRSKPIVGKHENADTSKLMRSQSLGFSESETIPTTNLSALQGHEKSTILEEGQLLSDHEENCVEDSNCSIF
jgi:outer membrane protein assembly factor BamB